MAFRRSKGLDFTRKKNNVSAQNIKEAVKLLFSVLIAVASAWFLVYNFGCMTSVIGSSMEPRLYNGQTTFINRLSFLFTSPRVGDVVVFYPNGNVNTHYYVKRVVALPGDKVQIIDGYLYINGEPYEGRIDYDKIAEEGLAAQEITLLNDEYFVLGDNINFSEDSRSGNIGPVKREYIYGKAWFKLGKEDSHFGFL